MSTSFEFSATVDAPISRVWDCLADRDFWAERLNVVGSQKDVVEAHTASADTIDTELKQVVAGSHIPAAAKRFVRGDMPIERFVHYEADGEDAYSGRSHGAGVGGLLKVSGEIRATESEGRTTEIATGTVTVSVPLIGGRLERAVIDYLRQAHERELAFVTTYNRD